MLGFMSDPIPRSRGATVMPVLGDLSIPPMQASTSGKSWPDVVGAILAGSS